jgi:hypothetical protein
MRTSPIRIAKLLFFCIIAGNVFALDTSVEEKTCSEIGFKRKTEAFGNCVLELFQRKGGQDARNQSQTAGQAPISNDPDDATCRKYGFKAGTNEYAQCKQQIAQAKQDAQRQQAQYEAQQRQYQAQLIEQKRQRETAASMALLNMGLGMMAGGSPQTNFGPPPVAPQPPANLNRTYILPGGRMMNCNTTGSITNCF